MTEKLNARYGSTFDSDQKLILREYVFSKKSGDSSSIEKSLSEIKNRCIDDLEKYSSITKNKIVLEKIREVSNKILSESISEIDDSKISKFLVMMQLKRELQEAINE